MNRCIWSIIRFRSCASAIAGFLLFGLVIVTAGCGGGAVGKSTSSEFQGALPSTVQVDRPLLGCDLPTAWSRACDIVGVRPSSQRLQSLTVTWDNEELQTLRIETSGDDASSVIIWMPPSAENASVSGSNPSGATATAESGAGTVTGGDATGDLLGAMAPTVLQGLAGEAGVALWADEVWKLVWDDGSAGQGPVPAGTSILVVAAGQVKKVGPGSSTEYSVGTGRGFYLAKAQLLVSGSATTSLHSGAPGVVEQGGSQTTGPPVAYVVFE